MLRPVQDRAQFAVKRGENLAAFRPRRQRNLLDQAAQCLRRFLPLLLAIERLRQGRNLLRIDRRGARQNVRCVLWRVGQQGVQFGLARLQRVHLCLHALMEHASLDRLDDAADLLLDLHQFCFPGIAAGAAFPVQPISFLGIGAHRLLDDLRRHHAVLQAGEHACFQILTRDRAAV
ncbi:hypothetical protein [Agrobacterium cavarae]|uniref:hypothetical protein n=1 Tax=Agrobacterium cavarae TaxID=2528239 RepID=UPI001FE09CD7|nr:hypothetical protein [Agrobacterium cavarae]